MKFVPALPAALLLCGAAQVETHAQVPTALDCAGAFARDASHARLEQVFGRDNVTFETVPGAEGSEEKATLVFGKDPKRAIHVYWHDETRRQRPSMIAVEAGSTWRTVHGLAVGTPIAEVEKLNGKAFTLYGFEWDYGGSVTDWKGGALARPVNGCKLSVRFEPGPNPPQNASRAVAGDKKLSSDNPNMRAVKLVVSNISVGYPE